MKRLVSAVCATVLVVTGLQVTTTSAAAAAEPREITVVQPDRGTGFQADQIIIVGATGFLHQYAAGRRLWTRYADGLTTDVTDAVGTMGWSLAGGDTVWTAGQVPGHSTPGSVTTLDLSTMTWRSLARPDTGSVNLYGDTMLVRPALGPLGWSLRRFAADGSFTTVPVTGMPEDATNFFLGKGDPRAVVMRINSPTAPGWGLLDLRTGVIDRVTVDLTAATTAVVLSADRVAFRLCWINSDVCQVRIHSRADLAATPVTLSVARNVPDNRMLLVGTHLVGSPGLTATTTARQPAFDYSVADQPVVVPLTQTELLSIAQGSTGGLIVGGAVGQWAVRRLTVAADGTLEQKVVVDLMGRQLNAGVTLSYGLLHHIQTQQLAGDPAIRHQLFNHSITATGSTPAPPGHPITSPLPCQDGSTCLRSVSWNPYGTSYLSTAGYLAQNSSINWPLRSTRVEGATRLVDASPSYAVVDAVGGVQHVVKPEDANWRMTGPAGGAALWFDTLWSNNTPGSLRGTDLTTRTTVGTVPTAAGCVADEVQAAARQILWSCRDGGPTGVYDTGRKVTIGLPAGRYLLGDNYVVRHDSATGQLLRYDVSGGALGQPVVVGSFTSGSLLDDRNITWAVDKHSGNIAWVDEGNAVHIIDPAVPRSAPALVGTSHYNGEFIYFGTSREFYGTWDLSRPIDSWQLTVTRVAGGAVVATRTGGAAVSSVSASWDGRLVSGDKAPSGRYRYTLDVTAEGTTTRIDTNTVGVQCGTTPYRSYSCDGQVSVLGVFKSGESHWLTITNGAIQDHGASESWYLNAGTSPVTTAIVPFGDLNRDGHNDLLTRTAAGALTLHYGLGQPHFGGSRTKTIGTGWGGFRQILTSGDLTGDGIPDVLAQDSAGVLRRFNGTTATSLANGVVVPGAWSQPKLIGPGDVTGDGKADLYAVNSAGQLELFPGTGNGTFGAAQRIGTGWGPYTLVGIGDTNEDLRNDLVARDAAGTFWLYPGNGAGGFGTRKQLATGYQKFQGLY